MLRVVSLQAVHVNLSVIHGCTHVSDTVYCGGSSPACKCVSTWGFTDAYNRWGEDGNTFYYDSNYRPKALRGSVAALLQAQISHQGGGH